METRARSWAELGDALVLPAASLANLTDQPPVEAAVAVGHCSASEASQQTPRLSELSREL
jgi:hypothetical protein